MIDHAPDQRFAASGSRTNVERIIDLAISGAQHDRDPREVAQALVEAAGANRALLSAARNTAAELAERSALPTFERAERFLQLAYADAPNHVESTTDADEQDLDLREPGWSSPGQ